MSLSPQYSPPEDAPARRKAAPVICYPVEGLPAYDAQLYDVIFGSAALTEEIIIAPRQAVAFHVPAGHIFKIISIEGPQVGDLNLWNAADLSEHFYSGKTRALHATHLTRGDRLWSSLPQLRPLATIIRDSLDWYGWDEDGGGVHDVIGTRCDPYSHKLLSGGDYHHCCHSNLTRALAAHLDMELAEAEAHIHDVLNVFMCTGFTKGTHQYFMKASPVRPGDALSLFAEMDLVAALSACPGGDCGQVHSSDAVSCYPLKVEILSPSHEVLANWRPFAPSQYDRSHGTGSDLDAG